MISYILVFSLLSTVWAKPVDRLVPKTIAAPVAAETGTPKKPVDFGTPIEGSSFFSITSSCFSDKRVRKGYNTRADFYKTAYKDAVEIADASTKWPQLGTDASDLYFGKNTEDSRYAKDIIDNLKVAADWDHPRWGFDPYIILTCDDRFNACKGKIGDDPRQIACYVNNTADIFSTISYVSCCDPFFQLENNDERFEDNKNEKNLNLNYMRTSGSFLLHEMMHTTKVTQTRPLIKDSFFTGSSKRRIYGPSDVAKAARVESLDVTTGNADSYAEFALALYWKDIFQGRLPQPTGTAPAPAGYVDLISDNDNNYIDMVSPDPTPSCPGTTNDKPSTSQAYAQDKINTYCNYVASSGWIVNSTVGSYGPVEYAASSSKAASNDQLWISVAFDPQCNANVSYTVVEDECKNSLSVALNGCNTASGDKWGGQVQANCALWNITTRFGQDETPPNGYPKVGKKMKRAGTTFTFLDGA